MSSVSSAFPVFGEDTSRTLLLHVCCAPCASGCLDLLLGEAKRKVVLFFSNSNIATEEEFQKRLASVEKLASVYKLDLLVDSYDHASWLDAVSVLSGYQDEPERGKRCSLCFGWSLGQTAAKAEMLNMNFATTLTVSPHKNSKVIFDVGAQYSGFEAWDFKKNNGFQTSLRRSRELNLYRQNFCGCEFLTGKR